MGVQISVIVPTYNGGTKLEGLLRSLQGQDFPNFEVIVVVDGSTDDTIERLKHWAWWERLRIVSQANGGRAAARNAGVREAKGDLLVFFDDDVFLPKADVLHRHWLFHSGRTTALLSGSVPFAENGTDFQQYRRWLSFRWIRHLEGAGVVRLVENNLFFTAANCSFWKTTWEQVAGFDALMKDAEDYDLAKRAFGLGFEIYFDSNLLVEHHDFVPLRAYIGRLRQYEQARPATIRGRFFKKIFFALWVFPFWIRALEKTDGWLKRLPTLWRYRVYSWVLTAWAVYFPEKKLK